jgi:ABC-type uncharacterized transport system ATPase subunit
MARWVPARADVIGELADEILHNYRNGRAVVGVDGVPGSGQAAFADDLADAFRERDMVAYRGTANAQRDADGSIVRAETIAPFRAGRATTATAVPRSSSSMARASTARSC